MKINYSCVVANSTVLISQSFIWLNSLISYGILPSEIYVHLIEEIPREYENFLNEKKINVVKCKPFDIRNKYCNKLQQLSTFEYRKDFDYVLLMDCDTAVVTLEGLELTEKIYAKIVDFPNPPVAILEQLYEREGFVLEQTSTSFSKNGENKTDWNNCNGGLYIIHRDFLPMLAPKWKQYALKCLENKNIFTPEYEKHADQVGFSLAMAALGEKVEHLDIRWNYPIHVDTSKFNVKPKIIHFHNELKNQINLRKTGIETIDFEIEKINCRINENFNDNNYSGIHSRDIGQEKLLLGNLLTDHPNLLNMLVSISRDNFGFFTSHFPRVFEYTWLIQNLENSKDLKIIDIGAGVCPLPLCLSEMGSSVTTIDSHPEIRIPENKEYWNEWGFLDYSHFDSRIRSENLDFQDFKSNQQYDVIYSISVIEHMPAKTRRRIIRKAANLLKIGGRLLLTVDIIPNSIKIWNMSENKQVEDQTAHGNIDDLKKEISKAGFEIIEDKVQREILDSRTDVYFITAQLKRKSIFSKILSL